MHASTTRACMLTPPPPTHPTLNPKTPICNPTIGNETFQNSLAAVSKFSSQLQQTYTRKAVKHDEICSILAADSSYEL